jgi:hypothetical protein
VGAAVEFVLEAIVAVVAAPVAAPGAEPEEPPLHAASASENASSAADRNTFVRINWIISLPQFGMPNPRALGEIDVEDDDGAAQSGACRQPRYLLISLDPADRRLCVPACRRVCHQCWCD